MVKKASKKSKKAPAKSKKAPVKATSRSYKTIKRFDVLSVAWIYCLIMAIVALIIGAINTIISIVTGAVPLGPSLLWLLLLIIAYAVLGFVFGALGAWIYNGLACKIGGVKLELE